MKKQGLSIKDIANCLNVSSKTIERDLIELGIETWSSISDEELMNHIVQIIEIEHKAVGIKKIESHLLLRGLRIQESRIKDILVRIFFFFSKEIPIVMLTRKDTIVGVRAPPIKVKRR